jgi:hypothetical protein
MPQKKAISHIDIEDVLLDIKVKQCLLTSTLNIVHYSNGNEKDLNEVAYLLSLYQDQMRESLLKIETILSCQVQ